ncbi:hypothetical protein C0995_002081 [Termitomyces sp. Mi166|nr:hypothetical protein C0995_002081 [Termitomyces sp. Mi166\
MEEWGEWAVAHRQKMAAKYGTAEPQKRSTGTTLGQASGRLGSDVVQMAGFSVSNQTFAICDNVSQGLLSNPVSGLLGLAFESIAASGAVPFWQTLAASGAWDSPVMAFHLTRYLNDTTARVLEYGGSLSMGFVNESLYTGDIEYLDLAATESYWILPLTTLTTNGQSISIPSGSDSYAAIDTGTTLVGGPSKYLDEFYSQIPGARPGTGKFEGYYTYRQYRYPSYLLTNSTGSDSLRYHNQSRHVIWR